MDLTQKHCVPCEGGTSPLPNEKEDHLITQTPDWLLVRDGRHKITREFRFKTFRQALRFVNGVADLAESEGHHPDITIVYNRVRLDLFTHAVGGLLENDFIMAAKINGLLKTIS